MARPLEELRKIRLEKLGKLCELGIDPYPSGWDRLELRVKNQELMEMELGSDVVVAGRIRAWREHGGIIFADIHDDSGKIQLCFRKDRLSADSLQLSALLDIGDFIGVSGELFKTKSGELTVLVKDFKLLSKSLRPLPSQWYGLKDVEERYRKRYLDLLMNPEVREVFEVRTRLLTLLRKYLDERGFIEVETPILQPLYGGASARPFTTHIESLGTDFYLRISDELYLKRLIVGGFEKVYEVSKDFRNEGIDRQHSPEFTQIEFYWAYADYKDLMKFSEEMLSFVIKGVKDDLKVEFEGKTLDFTPPWPRVVYRDLVLKHTGIDINGIKAEKELREAILDKGLKLDLSGVVGYGPLIDALYKEYCRPQLVQPTFLIDHPAELMPLAKRKPEDPSKIESVQLLAAGYEMFKAYSELNDPVDQKERWEEQEGLAKKGLEEHEVLDADYIEALEYAMPPTAGWGMGIDRLTAILTDQHTIRDVILFPLMRPEKVREGNPKEKGQALGGEGKELGSGIPGLSSKTPPELSPKEPSSGEFAARELLVIDKAVRKRFPEIKVGMAVIKEVEVKKKVKELENFKKEVLAEFKDLKVEDIGEMPTIKAYRELFRAFGADFHSRRPSPEALLRRIATGKGLYKVNNVVDAYNLAVLQTKIGLGAFDLDQLILPKVLRFAEEGEGITLLGESKPTVIHEGELIYADQNGSVTLDLNYRDCDRTKITSKTKNILLVADGCSGINREEVEKALDLGCELITRFAGGEVVQKLIV